MKNAEIRRVVRENYGTIAKQSSECCTTAERCGCSCNNLQNDITIIPGYSDKELTSVPEGANLGLGCGNPVAIASLKAGETVLDLGSGAGFDCFLASNAVGEHGKVIGVDMTPEMIAAASQNAVKNNYTNVEFRLGQIENLPVADASIDVIISNCVVNLSPEKKQVFAEAIRVLKPGGRLILSDIVLLKKLPDELRDSITAYVSCIAGAVLKDEYIEMIKTSGFNNIEIIGETPVTFNYSLSSSVSDNPKKDKGKIHYSAVSVQISAIKPVQ